MVKCVNGQYSIEFHDFEYLLDRGGWKLCKPMKDNWTAKEHVDYIISLIVTKANLQVKFIVDNCNIDSVCKIDVLISPDSHNTEDPTTSKHIQFINYQTKKADEKI